MSSEMPQRNPSRNSDSSYKSRKEYEDALSAELLKLTLTPIRPENLRPSWMLLKRPGDWLEGMPRTGIVYDTIMLQHGERDCPERPERLTVPMNRLQREGTLQRCFRLDARMATMKEICRVHSTDHVSRVRKGKIKTGVDLQWKEGATLSSALCSAGSTLQAMESVLNGALDNAFALVRPPGHHAEPHRAQGFCFFNNVAIAALEALSCPNLCKRVAIIDWDVHHGNGIQQQFYDTDNVLYISIHRGGDFYPGTGKAAEIGTGKGTGFNVNIPWPGGGFGDPDYLLTFDALVVPLIDAFQPDLMLVSAGFDAVLYDPLGGLCVSPECFAQLTHRLLQLTKSVVMVLEGGYNLIQLSVCVDGCTRVLLGDQPPRITASMQIRPETEDLLLLVAGYLEQTWPVLSKDRMQKRIKEFEERMAMLM